MSFRIQIRRDTKNKWAVNNPILLEGEFGYETDKKRIKIGDGVTPWNELIYFGASEGGGGNLTIKSNGILKQDPTTLIDFSKSFKITPGASENVVIGLDFEELNGTLINVFENKQEIVHGATGINFIAREGTITTDENSKFPTINLIENYAPVFRIKYQSEIDYELGTFVEAIGPDGRELTVSEPEGWGFEISKNGNSVTVIHNLNTKPFGLSVYATNGDNVFITVPFGVSSNHFSLISHKDNNSFSIYGLNAQYTGLKDELEIIWQFQGTPPIIVPVNRP